MPYISKSRRENLDDSIELLCKSIKNQLKIDTDNFKSLPDTSPENLLELSGDLNYTISRICSNVMELPSYKKIAIITGVLENVKQEFYRRVAESYEDSKIKENEDIKEYSRLPKLS